MSSKKKFNVKDKVFAKRRGYPAWPAIISSVKSDDSSQIIYNVYFYGFGDYVECNANKIVSYEENKSKLSNPVGTVNKLKHFSEALIQIENDINTPLSSENNAQLFKATNYEEEESNFIRPSVDKVKCTIKLNSMNLSKEEMDFNGLNKIKIKLSNFQPNRLSKKSTKNISKKLESINPEEKDPNANEKNRSEDRVLVENDSEESVLSEVDTQVSLTPSTSERKSHTDKNENDDEIQFVNEFNSESTEKFIYDDSGLLNKYTYPLSRKKTCLTTSKKWKKSHEIYENIHKIPLKNIDMKRLPVAVVLLELFSDSQIAMLMNKKQNSKTDENTDVSQHITETSESHTTESNDVLLDSNETSKINDCDTISETVSTSNLNVSRFGRRIKSNKYTSAEKPKHSKLGQKAKIENAKTKKAKTTNNTNTSSSYKSDYSSEQNCISKGTSLSSETNDSLLTTSETSILTNNSESMDINQFQFKISDEDILPDELNDLMTASLSDIPNCMDTDENKDTQIDLLQTEVDLLDYMHELRLALQLDNVNYDKALEVLENTNKLKINALMLIKHPDIINTINSVMNYIGNRNECNLSEYEAIKYVEEIKVIRNGARQIFKKCSSLFTVPDGQTFQEVFEKKVISFEEITKDLSCDEIYSLTSN